MDTTPKYIEMSEKALKDLAEFQPHIQHEEVPHGVNVIELDYNGNWWFNRDNEVLVSLFRQDQLQEMAAKMPTWTDTRPVNVLCRFWNWWRNSDWELCSDDTTLEQLWLAFVMNEKFKKVWNGKDWVKT